MQTVISMPDCIIIMISLIMVLIMDYVNNDKKQVIEDQNKLIDTLKGSLLDSLQTTSKLMAKCNEMTDNKITIKDILEEASENE